MKKEISFIIWVSDDSDSRKTPVLTFDEHVSSDDILERLIKLEEIGINCCLTCEIWSVPENSI